MTDLFTLIVFAVIVVSAMAFAESPLSAATRAATAYEQSSDADNFEGRVVAKIRTRNVYTEVSRDRGEPTGAYWGSPLF
jgi:uncharacterized membrane protein